MLKDGNTKAAVVIDVGCARYGGDYSIERLVEEFFPDHLIGFDPNTDKDGDYMVGETSVSVRRHAAWTFSGEVPFLLAGTSGRVVGPGEMTWKVPCADLAETVGAARETHGGPLVLKLDCEGAEYVLLPHLIDTGAAKWVDLAWVEWHPKTRKNASVLRGIIEAEWPGEMIEWNW